MERRDFVIFTVVNHYGGIYVVSLDEYEGQIAYIIGSFDFNIGDRSVGEVTCIVGNNIIVDTINGLSDKDKKLFMLCYKFRTLDGPKDGWANVCRDAIYRSIDHPYDLISDRSFVENGLQVFPKEYNDCVRRNHAILFGFYPSVITKQFTSSNPEKVAKFKDNFSRHYFHSQLWKNRNLFNLAIVNLSDDLYLIRVSAYLPSKCESIMFEALNNLNNM